MPLSMAARFGTLSGAGGCCPRKGSLLSSKGRLIGCTGFGVICDTVFASTVGGVRFRLNISSETSLLPTGEPAAMEPRLPPELPCLPGPPAMTTGSISTGVERFPWKNEKTPRNSKISMVAWKKTETTVAPENSKCGEYLSQKQSSGGKSCEFMAGTDVWGRVLLFCPTSVFLLGK